MGPRPPTHAYSHSYRTWEELWDKILGATTENSKISLQMGNARLAAHDFRTKFEKDQAPRMSVEVEVDMSGLHEVLGQLSLARARLEMQAAAWGRAGDLKKNHAEDISALRGRVAWT